MGGPGSGRRKGGGSKSYATKTSLSTMKKMGIPDKGKKVAKTLHYYKKSGQ